jgi:S1-C subfamily serine protease
MFKRLSTAIAILILIATSIGCCHYAMPYVNKVKDELVPRDTDKGVVALAAPMEKVVGKKHMYGVDFASGFAVDKNHIITAGHFCNHVIAGFLKKEVKSLDLIYLDSSDTARVMLGAKIVAIDDNDDICLIERVDHGLLVLPVATQMVKKYDKVFLFGAPAGIFPIRTQGEVAITHMKGTDPRGKSVMNILVTAPGTGGSSGGPCVNSKGEVIGITSFKPEDFEHAMYLVPFWSINKFLKANAKLLK